MGHLNTYSHNQLQKTMKYQSWYQLDSANQCSSAFPYLSLLQDDCRPGWQQTGCKLCRSAVPAASGAEVWVSYFHCPLGALSSCQTCDTNSMWHILNDMQWNRSRSECAAKADTSEVDKTRVNWCERMHYFEPVKSKRLERSDRI